MDTFTGVRADESHYYCFYEGKQLPGKYSRKESAENVLRDFVKARLARKNQQGSEGEANQTGSGSC